MKLKINLKAIWLFAGLGTVFLIAMVYAATSYKVGPGQTVTVTPAGGGSDYTVKNKTSNKTYFVPNKTFAEWDAFLTACQNRLSGDLQCNKVTGPSLGCVTAVGGTWSSPIYKTADQSGCDYSLPQPDVPVCMATHPGCAIFSAYPNPKCISYCHCSSPDGGKTCTPNTYYMTLDQICCNY